jgi:3-isopropylmalate/(R)-2-methylmalate dehydratase large subunit
MGKTIAGKIISSHTELHSFEQGEIINVSVDFAFANDVTGPFAIKCFEDVGKEEVLIVKK